MKSAEQQARDMLERAGVPNAQDYSAGDLVEIANLIAFSNANGPAELKRGVGYESMSEIDQKIWNPSGTAKMSKARAQTFFGSSRYAPLTWYSKVRLHFKPIIDLFSNR